MKQQSTWIIMTCLLAMLYANTVIAQDDTEQGQSTDITDGVSGEAVDTASNQDVAGQNTGSSMDKGTYTVRLRDLEERVNRLKEQIFRSKARLSLLAETVLEKKIAGAKASIVFNNEMGGSFRLDKATFLMDGGPVFNKVDNNGSLSKKDKIDLFEGPITPGEHTLSVVLHYKGHGYGIFSYLKGYAFKTRSSYTFTVGEGKRIGVEIVGFEKGGATTPLEERPAVKYIENVVDYEDVSSESGESGQ